MKSLFNYKLPITLVAVAAFATAANADVRYKDRMFTVEKTKNVVYAEDVPHLKSLHDLTVTATAFDADIYFYKNEVDVEYKPLKMDIYSPNLNSENIVDSEKGRAAVIVAHGGAFIGGAKDDIDQKSVAYCDSLAARGFVTASIEYRLGVTMSGDFNLFSLAMGGTTTLSIDSVDFARAVYRGVQDINAAVRYLRANAETYGIDPERIYVLGNSAGAILSIENIYTNSEEDFPDYSYKGEKKDGFTVRPYLGGLNDYGVETDLDAHANGAVALWGATHDPAVLKYNKTPIFLAHGDNDGTVKFDAGYPLSDAKGMLKRNLPVNYASLADQVDLKVETPKLYGSYIIDSVLTVNNGTKAKPATLFVKGAGHEFYDESKEKEQEVQSRVFDFLYKLATADKVIHALAGVTIARANDKQDYIYAVLDGGYDGTDALNITDKIEVDSLSFNRKFTPLTYSTLTLPFSVKTNHVNGLEAALRYSGIGKDKKGNDAVKMKVVWATEKWVEKNDIKDANGKFMTYGNEELAANTPYLVQMGETGVFRLTEEAFPLTLEATSDAETSLNSWIFRGTWQYKKWGAKGVDPETGNAYGFAAKSENDKIQVGDFVRVGEGAWITPMRAYLVKANAQGVRANGAYAVRPSELPEIMSVIVDNGDANEEHTTVIGHFNTRTGEFRMNNAGARTYDLKGRYVGDKANKARGAYYGKKFLK